MISTGRSRRRAALEVVGVVAAIAATTLVAPDFGYESRYRLEDIGVGEPGRLREFDVTVTSVRLTRSIEKYSDVLTTDDAFVVLTVQAVVRTDVQNLHNVELGPPADTGTTPSPTGSRRLRRSRSQASPRSGYRSTRCRSSGCAAPR